MKRISASLVIVLFAVSLVHAQQSMRFRIAYKPSTTYRQVIDQSTSIEIKYGGSPEMLSTLKEQGQDSVMKQMMSSTMNCLLKTGKAATNGEFPLVMEIKQSLAGDNDMNTQSESKLFGHASATSFPVYDSIEADGVPDDQKQALLSSISGALSQVKFPDKEMKPGDEFRQESPISLPMGGMGDLGMNIITIYKLRSIKDGIGYLDFTLEYTGGTEVQDVKMPLKGTGGGKMEVDIANNLARYTETNTDMFMDVEAQGVTMNMKMQLKSTATISIVKK